TPAWPLLRDLLPYHDTPTPDIYTLSLHDALPISRRARGVDGRPPRARAGERDVRGHQVRRAGAHRGASSGAARSREPDPRERRRSEEHTSELQSRFDLVCRLLLEKKKKKRNDTTF